METILGSRPKPGKLASPRIYKPAYEPDRAREIILAESGAHFDPAIVEAFFACFEKFRLGAPDEGAWAQPPVKPAPVWWESPSPAEAPSACLVSP